jgi:hypothetical protein
MREQKSVKLEGCLLYRWDMEFQHTKKISTHKQSRKNKICNDLKRTFHCNLIKFDCRKQNIISIFFFHTISQLMASSWTIVLHAHRSLTYTLHVVFCEVFYCDKFVGVRFLVRSSLWNYDTSISNFEEEIWPIWVWPKFPKNKRKKKKLLTSLWGWDGRFFEECPTPWLLTYHVRQLRNFKCVWRAPDYPQFPS